jgi:hypothetical protein
LLQQLSSFLIMNQLLIDKKFDLVVDTFQRYIKVLRSGAEREGKLKQNRTRTQMQTIPFGHLRLAAEALMEIV